MIAPLADKQTYRRLLFLLAAVPIGAVAATVLFAGWLLTGLLAITPLVVPVLIGFRAALGMVGAADAWLARNLLGEPVRPAARRPRQRRGFWSSGWDVFTDPAFWKQQAYLLFRYLPGGAIAIALVAALGAGIGWIAAPIYYRWGDALDFGSVWQTDTFLESLVFVPAGVVVLLLTAWLIGPLARASGALANGLLGTDAGVDSTWTASALRHPAELVRSLRIHAAVAGGIVTVQVVIWALTTRAYFWPEWVILPLALLLAVHTWVTAVLLEPRLTPPRLGRGFAMHLGIWAALGGFLVAIWALTTKGYFWPVWPILGLAMVVLAHLTIRFLTSPREAELEQRIDVLTTTRAGAVDAQGAELRRIERDLHDGAQARLVALGMSIGMAEQKLATDPEAAMQLLAEARLGAHEALEELRDLARGIHPPVLADRGLEAAVNALAARAPFPVRVSAEAGTRPPVAVESAAYFVVAEALANAGKHADPAGVDIRIARDRDRLVVEVEDDGPGGAHARGSGLTGLRRRLEALDGTLEVESPPGGPTVVRAELPCGW